MKNSKLRHCSGSWSVLESKSLSGTRSWSWSMSEWWPRFKSMSGSGDWFWSWSGSKTMSKSGSVSVSWSK